MARTAFFFPGLIVLTLTLACNGGNGKGDADTDAAEDRVETDGDFDVAAEDAPVEHPDTAEEDLPADDLPADDAPPDETPADPVEEDAPADADDGEEAADVPAEEAPAYTPLEYCIDIYTALCAHLAACCTAGEMASLETIGFACAGVETMGQVRDCNQKITRELDASTSIHFDAVRAQECVGGYTTYLSTGGCALEAAAPTAYAGFMAEYPDRFAECAFTLYGDIAPGDPCTEPLECTPGSFCDRHGSSGTCVARGVADAPCDRDIACMQTLVCDPATSTCRPPGGDGAECGSYLECDLDHACDAAVDPPVCRPWLEPGEACDNGYDDCTGLFCDLSGGAGVCADICDGL